MSRGGGSRLSWPANSQLIGEKKLIGAHTREKEGELTIAQIPALQGFYAPGSWGKAGNVYVQ